MSKEEIEQLAQSLKNSGLAASMEDAIKKAEEMLKKKNKGQAIKVDKPKTEEVKEEPEESAEEPEDSEEEVKKEEKQTELFVTKEAEEDINKKEPTEEEKEKTDLTKMFYYGNKEE